MKRPTIKRARACHPLAPAVLQQLGGGINGAEAMKRAIDAARHGADAGWHGFTCSGDLRAFVRKNRREIVESIERRADYIATPGGAVGLVRTFRYICMSEGGKPRYTADEVERALWGDLDTAEGAIIDALAWYALEEVGRAIRDEAERGS